MSTPAFAFDANACIGCMACVTSCCERNGLGPTKRLRTVTAFEGGGWTIGPDGVPQQRVHAYYVSMTCAQCDEPTCVSACPTEAMQKDPDTGIVRVDESLCIGCMMCEEACPYHHPFLGADGVARKCTLCFDRLGERPDIPVCAHACPTHALSFGPIDELRERFGSCDAIGDLPSTTAPNMVFVPHRSDPAHR